MEKTQIIETVLVTTKTGKTTVFDCVQSVEPHTWTRYYARGTECYYSPAQFEAGLASGKAVKIERIDLFSLPFVGQVDKQGCLVARRSHQCTNT